MSNLERARIWKVKHDQKRAEFLGVKTGEVGDPWDLLFNYARQLDALENVLRNGTVACPSK
jgi:hypothetical protein